VQPTPRRSLLQSVVERQRRSYDKAFGLPAVCRIATMINHAWMVASVLLTQGAVDKTPPKYLDLDLAGAKLGSYGWKHDPKSGYYLMTSCD
jgi:hypothetical protein